MVYIPGFGVMADYLAILLTPLTSGFTTRLAKAAEYRKPLSRKERRAVESKKNEMDTWRELGLSPNEVCLG